MHLGNNGANAMKNQKFDLSSIRIATPCIVPWSSMAGDDRVRHCDSCRMNVYNIAGMTADEAEGLIQNRDSRLCLRLYRRPDGTVITKDCPVGLRAYQKRVARMAGAAMTAILGLFSISYGQTEDVKATDASKVKIERTIDPKGVNSISGTVVDPNGAVVPGARITISNRRSNRTVVSDDSGNYRFDAVPSGKWELTATFPAFKTRRIKDLQVGSSEQIQLNIELLLAGEVTIGIYVDTDDPSVDVTATGTTKIISNRRMESIPHED